MAVTLAILAFLFVSLSVVATALLVSAGGTAAIDRRLSELTASSRPNKNRPPRFASVLGVFKQVGERLPRSPKDMSKLRRRLCYAGFRRQDALPVFFAIRAVSALGLFIAFATPLLVRPNLMLAGAGLCLGYVLPGMVLARLARRRQHRIRLSLADSLDLLVVSVEAGLGLDQAIQRVGDELAFAYPDLSSELRLVNLELRAGEDRAAALRNLADRTGVEDLSALVTMLIQTDRFGTSVSQALRVHADTLRTKRRQRAEEAAAKTGVKMVFPLVFCIFPAIWVVTIGPAAIQFVKVLSPIIQNTQ